MMAPAPFGVVMFIFQADRVMRPSRVRAGTRSGGVAVAPSRPGSTLGSAGVVIVAGTLRARPAKRQRSAADVPAAEVHRPRIAEGSRRRRRAQRTVRGELENASVLLNSNLLPLGQHPVEPGDGVVV